MYRVSQTVESLDATHRSRKLRGLSLLVFTGVEVNPQIELSAGFVPMHWLDHSDFDEIDDTMG